MAKPYVVHHCKNKDCNTAWLDEDENNAQSSPPKWRYCPDCQAKGMVATKDPNKIARGQEMARYQKEKRLASLAQQ